MTTFSPSFSEFEQLARDYSVVPVFRRLLSDTLTPVSAAVRLGIEPWTFLFESVVGGERVGRYSFLGARPFAKFEASADETTWTQDGKVTRWKTSDPFTDLDQKLAAFRAPNLPGLPRFVGGAVGFLSYDSVRYVEKLPNAPNDDRHIPDLCFGFYDRMVVFDQISKQILVVALAHTGKQDAKAAFDDATSRVDEWVNLLKQADHTLSLEDIDLSYEPTLRAESNFTQAGFELAVEKCKEYIRAGDIFQVVPSQRWHTKTSAKPFDIYRTLRVVNPSPFMVFLQSPTCKLVGSSPEIMIRVENGKVTNRPLAGTRPRGKTPADDNRLAEELINDPKERAEHIMLVDLARNDLGRVCEFNSIQLEDLLTVERYSHVMHITSNVTGQLKPGMTAVDALRACLPAGTVSGAPKVRAMEIIDELEPCRRGPYAGAIGYIDFTGNMDTCIALRTMVVVGDDAYLQAGAGIVYDSDPTSEYMETVSKAKVLFKAIQLTEQRGN